jgi:hypothetical protein
MWVAQNATSAAPTPRGLCSAAAVFSAAAYSDKITELPDSGSMRTKA